MLGAGADVAGSSHSLAAGDADVGALGATVQAGVVAQHLRIRCPNGTDVGDLRQALELSRSPFASDSYALHASFVIQPVDKSSQGGDIDHLRDVHRNQGFSGLK